MRRQSSCSAARTPALRSYPALREGDVERLGEAALEEGQRAGKRGAHVLPRVPAAHLPILVPDAEEVEDLVEVAHHLHHARVVVDADVEVEARRRLAAGGETLDQRFRIVLAARRAADRAPDRLVRLDVRHEQVARGALRGVRIARATRSLERAGVCEGGAEELRVAEGVED